MSKTKKKSKPTKPVFPSQLYVQETEDDVLGLYDATSKLDNCYNEKPVAVYTLSHVTKVIKTVTLEDPEPRYKQNYVLDEEYEVE